MYKKDLPAIGTAFGGGVLSKVIRVGVTLQAVILSGSAGELTGEMGTYGIDVPGANSYCDGRANTAALAAAGSLLALEIQALEINGEKDWHWPSRDEWEGVFRDYKPVDCENECSFRDGDNPSTVPTGYPYTPNDPGQTIIEGFREGEPDALADHVYLTSTQDAAKYAWGQHSDGNQDNYYKYYKGRVRAVRWIQLSDLTI